MYTKNHLLRMVLKVAGKGKESLFFSNRRFVKQFRFHPFFRRFYFLEGNI